MNKQDVINAIAVMQAWVDGEPIQCMTHFGKTWIDVDNPAWDWYNDKYRVKPQVVYRPYSSPEECVLDIRNNHSDGWLKVKNSACDAYIRLNNISSITDFREYFMNYTYADGTPFGLKIS